MSHEQGRSRSHERQLRSMLSEGVATRAMLERRGLWSTAERLALPTLTIDLTLRGQGSTRPQTCVALDQRRLDPLRTSPRILGHEVAATELMERRPIEQGQRWLRAQDLGAGRDTVPDWWLWDVPRAQLVAHMEVDVSYPLPRLLSKVRGALEHIGDSVSQHPVGYILATTREARVAAFIDQVEALAEELPTLGWAEGWWVDVESSTDRYMARRRSTKATFARWDRPAAPE